jgi:hypothetical protein
MKFRTIRRIIYLKKARHRRGHGIHSPFLFHLITEVVENRHKVSEYKIFKNIKDRALNLLEDSPEKILSTIYQQFNLTPSNPHRLYRKVELPLRYAKVVFRLLHEFKPLSLVSHGPSFGANLAFMALASCDTMVYQSVNDPACSLISNNLLKALAISNVQFFNENSSSIVKGEFVMINYPYKPAQSRSVFQTCLSVHGEDDVVIIRGIHESKEMEAIWQEGIDSESVRVSLDLFEIGIALFRCRLQKENFIQRF